MSREIKSDILVIGSGIAGLMLAIDAAGAHPSKHILVLSKGNAVETGTSYAQGGIAVVTSPSADSIDQHVEDTLLAGAGLCREEVVRMVTTEGLARILDLEKYGLHFDRDEEGAYDLHLEGGHRTKRILHFRDRTGRKIQETLLKKAMGLSNIDILEQHQAIDLLVNEKRCSGCLVLNKAKGEVYVIQAGKTVLATGGLGHVFRHTTNPPVCTGDGVAMAHRAGAGTANLEFIQFHPTAFYTDDHSGQQMNLISEAVRGAGAVLLNDEGRRFMPERDARAELAPRDIVSREIAYELDRSGTDHVFLDSRSIDGFGEKFPQIDSMLKDHRIQASVELIPVVPAAHYSCGGVETDEWGRTKIENLLACGECACTGMHGANRLASNSLLESLVFAHRCAIESLRNPGVAKGSGLIHSVEVREFSREDSTLAEKMRRDVQSAMSEYFSIVCSLSGLKELSAKIEKTSIDFERHFQHNYIKGDVLELRNIIQASRLIVSSALNRQTNAGCFWNESLQSSVLQTSKK